MNNLGPQNHLFWWLQNLTATSTAYMFRKKHGIHNRASVFETKIAVLRHLKMSWTWSANGLKLYHHFTHPYKFCILLHCQASQMGISKWNSTKHCQTVDSKLCLTVCCRKVGVVPSKKIRDQESFTFVQFFDYFKTWWPISSEGSATYCKTLNVCVPFISRAKQNRKIKWRKYQLQAKIGWNYYSISNCVVLIRQNKRGQNNIVC